MTGPSGLYADGSAAFCRRERRSGETRLTVAFRTLRKAGVTQAFVRCAPDGEAEHHPCRCRRDGPFDRWEATLPVRGDRLGYRFALIHEGRLLHLNQRGASVVEPFDDEDFVWLDGLLPVSWLPGTTFYQIFPDRFARGSSAPELPGLRPWGQPPLHFTKGGCVDFYGGDLQGIEERIPYLQDLGVGALYLNPVFHAPSNHRYDVQDFRAIDPKLGSNADFARLVSSLHDAGIRVILDAVFNHVGSGHRWFNREGWYAEPGAWQSEEAPAAEFFVFHEHPRNYESWLGVDSLPKLDFRSARLRQEIYAGPDAVAKHWMRPPYGIDGWRFDVANMLGRCGEVQLHEEVWREMRRHLKGIRPDAYLMGEHYFDPRDLLDGSCLDGAMNYHGFYFPLLRWLTGREPQRPRGGPAELPWAGDAAHLADKLQASVARLPFQVASSQFNVVGSHDTPRIRTLVGGDRNLVSLAMTVMATWPGVPSIYYGDEVGLEGGPDPDCRRTMPWDTGSWDLELRGRVQALARIRRLRPPLAEGGVAVLHAQGDLFVYARILGRDALVVAANRGGRPLRRKLDLGCLGWETGELVSPLTGANGAVAGGVASLTLPPRGADVFEFARA